MRRLIVAFDNVDGWSKEVAGKKMDWRNRYPDIPEDSVYAVSTPEEAVATVEKYIDEYTTVYTGIKG